MDMDTDIIQNIDKDKNDNIIVDNKKTEKDKLNKKIKKYKSKTNINNEINNTPDKKMSREDKIIMRKYMWMIQKENKQKNKDSKNDNKELLNNIQDEISGNFNENYTKVGKEYKKKDNQVNEESKVTISYINFSNKELFDNTYEEYFKNYINTDSKNQVNINKSEIILDGFLDLNLKI